MNKTVADNQTTAARCCGVLFLALLSLVAVAVGATVFFSRQYYVGELLNSFRLQIGLVLTILATVWFCIRIRGIAFCLFALGVVVLFPIIAGMISVRQVPPGPKEIRLLSYNVNGRNQDKEPIVKFLRSVESDITVIVEYSDDWVGVLKGLKESHLDSLEARRSHGFGIAIFSRYELKNKKVVLLDNRMPDFPFLLAEVNVGDQHMILAAGHFLAPRSPELMALRNMQIASAAKLIERYRSSRDLPVLFVGDLNAVPWSPFVDDFLKQTKLRDSRQGCWYQGTWPTNNLLLRVPIDNAYVSKNICVHERRCLSCYSSDHLPIELTFSIAESE